jgi:VanZ family protein
LRERFSYFSGLLFSSIQPHTSPYEWLHLLADKGLHVTLFLILAVLLWKAIPPMRGKAGFILLAGLVVGSCSEFLQRFFPGRDPALRDVLINLGGTAIGLALSLILFQSRALSQPFEP